MLHCGRAPAVPLPGVHGNLPLVGGGSLGGVPVAILEGGNSAEDVWAGRVVENSQRFVWRDWLGGGGGAGCG